MKLDDPSFNENRNRYYGHRKGDLVKKINFHPGSKFIPDSHYDKVYEVLDYCPMDNNGIFIKEFNDKEPFQVVAEWTEVFLKVEDRPPILPEHSMVTFVEGFHNEVVPGASGGTIVSVHQFGLGYEVEVMLGSRTSEVITVSYKEIKLKG